LENINESAIPSEILARHSPQEQGGQGLAGFRQFFDFQFLILNPNIHQGTECHLINMLFWGMWINL
jgi:hypothetical protein